jgi:hypothetical protein
MSNHGGRFGPYKQALAAISARTGTPVSSLIVSFGILHELTAILPIAGFFYGARSLGVGDRLAGSLRRIDSGTDNELDISGDVSGGSEASNMKHAMAYWAEEKTREWVHEGGQWAERVGRRYGFFGFEKGSKPAEGQGFTLVGPKIAGDVANIIVAYAATKVRSAIYRLVDDASCSSALQALLPVRIGLSLYLTPGFARRIVDPFRSRVMSTFRRNQ